jgi:hypothetical protein
MRWAIARSIRRWIRLIITVSNQTAHKVGDGMQQFLSWLVEFLYGRPMTKQDILQDRLRVCASAGIKPESVSNFWVGIEELRPEQKIP